MAVTESVWFVIWLGLMTGKLCSHRHSLGFLRGAFLLSRTHRQHSMVNSTEPRQDPSGTPVVSCFFRKEFLWFLLAEFSEKGMTWRDVNFKAIPPTQQPKPKVSNKILWSVVPNAVLRSSMTRRVTLWISIFSNISYCTCTSAASALWNGL